MSFFRKVSVLAAIVVLLGVGVFPLVKAQEERGGSGLLISPTRTDLTAQPGELKNLTITLRNVTQGELVAQAFINDFEADNISGTPQIITDESQRTPNTIANMIEGLVDVELKPNQIKEVKLTLDIPGNAAPGAYFGAVRFAAVPKSAGQQQPDRQVSLTASVAHLVFVEVAGDITEQIQIEKVQAQRDGKGGSLMLKAPNQVSVGIKNLGNGFSRPFGQVTTKNMLGKEVNKYDINNIDPRGIVLPNSSRTFTDNIQGVKLPGRYTVTAAVAYGNGGEVVTYKSSFWYIPVWLLIALIVLIAAAGYGGRRKYQQRFGSTVKKRHK